MATIGIQRHCRVRAKDFSSPDGSSSPTEANAWYSSQMKTAGRKYRSGAAFICDGRRKSDCSQAFLSITPISSGQRWVAAGGHIQGQHLARLDQLIKGWQALAHSGPKSRLFVSLWNPLVSLRCHLPPSPGAGVDRTPALRPAGRI